LLAVFVAALVLAGCGGDAGSSEEAPHWDGPPRADAAGHVPVSGFNDYLAGDGKVFARSPTAATAEFLALDRASAVASTVQATSPGEVRNFSEVVATLNGLQDDSVRDARYTLEYQRNEDGDWRLRAADYAQRCQQGRGHQDFSPENCV
jgi:3',5'-cyclic AMP phosphodiesterase CpdA